MTELRYIRFTTADVPTPRWGTRRAARVHVLAQAPWTDASETGVVVAAADATLLAPAEPTKIVALGYNYRDLFEDPAARTSAREAHFTDPGFEPVLFVKGPNCLAGPTARVALRADATEVWVEVEVAAVIGQRARNLADTAAARAAVFGVTVGNDITALNVLGRDWHLARSKSLDGFCPLGPELVRGFDDADRHMRTTVDGRVMQDSTTANRVLDTYASVLFLSRLMTLEPGDVVMTGTPRGARQALVHVGSRATLEIAGLGTLVTEFVAEGAS